MSESFTFGKRSWLQRERERERKNSLELNQEFCLNMRFPLCLSIFSRHMHVWHHVPNVVTKFSGSDFSLLRSFSIRIFAAMWAVRRKEQEGWQEKRKQQQKLRRWLMLKVKHPKISFPHFPPFFPSLLYLSWCFFYQEAPPPLLQSGLGLINFLCIFSWMSTTMSISSITQCKEKAFLCLLCPISSLKVVGKKPFLYDFLLHKVDHSKHRSTIPYWMLKVWMIHLIKPVYHLFMSPK